MVDCRGRLYPHSIYQVLQRYIMRSNNNGIELYYSAEGLSRMLGGGGGGGILRWAIFKTGQTDIPENYRGIAILLHIIIVEKIFEVAVYKRLSYVNEAFCKIDEKNVGFLPGRRTTDNISMINGLVQRQLILGKCLIVWVVDFSKAFDMVNRNILSLQNHKIRMVRKSYWHTPEFIWENIV